MHQREAGAKGHVQVQAQASGGIPRHLYKARVGELEGNRLRERSMNNLWHVLNLRHYWNFEARMSYSVPSETITIYSSTSPHPLPLEIICLKQIEDWKEWSTRPVSLTSGDNRLNLGTF